MLVERLGRLQEAYPGFFGFMNWYPGGMEPFFKIVRAELSPQPTERVLDLGSGRGAFAAVFDARGYFGIDMSLGLVRYARKQYPSHLYAVMDGSSLGLKDDCFDAALIIGVLHHLDDEKALAALREIRRVLRPRGRVLIIEPIPVASRWNVVGRVIKSLDLGGFIRRYESWYSLVSGVLSLKKCYQHRIAFNDLVILFGTS